MFCTIEDHEAGFKDLAVTYRSGRTETVRVVAPSRRAMRTARADLLKDPDAWQIIRHALPGRDETFLDRLESGSADLVESTAFALAFGDGWEKKIASATDALAAAGVLPTGS